MEAVTSADVQRVAKKYIDPSHMTILIVGDRAKIESSIKELPFAKVVNILSTEGIPIVDSGKTP